MDFKPFDRRQYRTVSVLEGYSEWAATYEQTVPDQLDIPVLEKLKTLNLQHATECLDLACGTGRIGTWLKRQGVSNIDGLDITPEMLARARGKSVYRSLFQGSIEDSGLAGGRYDLLVMSLVDEHLPTLGPAYCEAHRLCVAGGRFVVVGMHPFFFMQGMPTHFNDIDGNPKAIETYIHLIGDHVKAALEPGWRLVEMHEGIIDDDWLQVKPKWAPLRGCPVNIGYVWERQARGASDASPAGDTDAARSPMLPPEN